MLKIKVPEELFASKEFGKTTYLFLCKCQGHFPAPGAREEVKPKGHWPLPFHLLGGNTPTKTQKNQKRKMFNMFNSQTTMTLQLLDQSKHLVKVKMTK